MSALVRRKNAELLGKLRSVPNEFAWWLAQSEPGEPLEKHHSQIRALTASLQRLVVHLEGRHAALGEDVAALAEHRKLERLVLDLHRIWDFFRQKLLQRGVAGFRSYLAACDELVWHCYAPAQRAYAAVRGNPALLREPPLVYMNADASPFALPRYAAYGSDVRRASGRTLTEPQFREVVKRLPIPVVGIPWFQLEHLPDALVLAHEAGHAVEGDFHLTAGLKANLRAALDAEAARLAADPAAPAGAVAALDGRRPGWEAWMGELFADACGVLAAGPAFVGTQIDFLSRARDAIAAETRPLGGGRWGLYPTDWLRIRVNCVMLEVAGFPRAAARLRAEWETVFPDHRLKAYEPDAAPVARALIEGRLANLGDRSIKEILVPFSETRQAELEVKAQAVAAGLPPGTNDTRELFAIARLAFAHDPQGWRAHGAGARLVAHIEKGRPAGTRSAATDVPPAAAARDAAAQATADDVLALLEETPADVD